MWRGLEQERFGEDQVRAIVALGGSEVSGVVLDRTNQVRKLFFWDLHRWSLQNNRAAGDLVLRRLGKE
jgi:hypothetical protein